MIPVTARVEAVVFDFGGVLTTSGREMIRAWTSAERIDPSTFSAAIKEWLSRRAPQGTPVHLLETGEMSMEEFNERLAARLRTVDGHQVAAEGLLGRLFAHNHVEQPMLDLVRTLRENGARTALLSNSWGAAYPWHVLEGLFECTVISGEVGLRKPDPRIYRLTLDKLGVEPQRAVFVDDARPNIEAAEALGMHAILHTDAPSTTAALAALTALPLEPT